MEHDTCSKCIHDSLCGCMMKDCIFHPNTDEYAVEMNTNTFRNRFMNRVTGTGSWINTGRRINIGKGVKKQ